MRTLEQKANWDETKYLRLLWKKSSDGFSPNIEEWFQGRRDKIFVRAYKQASLNGWFYTMELYSYLLVELGRREGWLEGYEYARG